MVQPQPKLWGIHCDEYSVDFLADGFVSVGWDPIGDLRAFNGDKDALKAEVAAKYPNAKPGAIPIWAGLLYRLAYEMERGDLVIYPHKFDKTVNIGRIDGDYYFEATAPTHRHRRPVKWLQTGLTRTPTFSQGALYEIGSAVTLFRVRKHDQEFLNALDGGVVIGATAPGTDTPPLPAVDPVSQVEDAPNAERIMESTRDFIVRTLATDFKGHPFAHFVAHLLEAMDYRTQVSPEGPDRGIDIIAHRDPLGLEPPIIKVQCKSTEGKISSPDVSGLLGTLGHNELGLFVTLGRFSSDAVNLGRDRPNLRLIDGDEVVDLVLEYYDRLGEEYKRRLPMRQVYVADRGEEV